MFLLRAARNSLVNSIFPKKCLGCGRQGLYLCADCLSVVEISHPPLPGHGALSRLYFVADYKHFLINRLIRKYKYPPFARELAKTLALLIITYLENLEKKPPFAKAQTGWCLVPIPLTTKRLKWRGFNQAEEVALVLSAYYSVPLAKPLTKIKITKPQANLSRDKRLVNIKGSFLCSSPDWVRNRNVVLVDDVSTTGATLHEAARALKKGGALEVQGLVVAKD